MWVPWGQGPCQARPGGLSSAGSAPSCFLQASLFPFFCFTECSGVTLALSPHISPGRRHTGSPYLGHISTQDLLVNPLPGDATPTRPTHPGPAGRGFVSGPVLSLGFIVNLCGNPDGGCSLLPSLSVPSLLCPHSGRIRAGHSGQCSYKDLSPGASEHTEPSPPGPSWGLVTWSPL